MWQLTGAEKNPGMAPTCSGWLSATAPGAGAPGHDQVLFGRDGAKGTRLAFSRKRMTVGMVNLL